MTEVRDSIEAINVWFFHRLFAISAAHELARSV